MTGFPQHFFKFRTDLFIRDPGITGVNILVSIRIHNFFVSQISQMDQQGQHIIFTAESFNVILKEIWIDLNFFTRDQFGNILLQPILIHINICQQRLYRGCILPI